MNITHVVIVVVHDIPGHSRHVVLLAYTYRCNRRVVLLNLVDLLHLHHHLGLLLLLADDATSQPRRRGVGGAA